MRLDLRVEVASLIAMINWRQRLLCSLWGVPVLVACVGSHAEEPVAVSSEVQPLIHWLLEDEGRLDDVPFSEVVEAVSECEVLPVNLKDEVDARMLNALTVALDDCLVQLNAMGHTIHEVGRVNEISRYVEDRLLKLLNATEGLRCEVPLNASGDRQRSGYPDLRLLDEASGRVFYVDPEIYRLGSEQSSFRTFYFEPKKATNKILDDASHLIVGVAHSGKVAGRWQLDHWKIVNLVDFRVRLKAEFQASNRELYQRGAVLRKSNDPSPK